MDLVMLPREWIYGQRETAVPGCYSCLWFFPDPVLAVSHWEAENLPFRSVNATFRHVIVKISLCLQQGVSIPAGLGTGFNSSENASQIRLEKSLEGWLSLRFPELNPVAFGIDDPSELAVRVFFPLFVDFHAF